MAGFGRYFSERLNILPALLGSFYKGNKSAAL